MTTNSWTKLHFLLCMLLWIKNTYNKSEIGWVSKTELCNASVQDEWYWVGICMHIKFVYAPISCAPPSQVGGGDYERGLTPASCPLVVPFSDCIFRAC